MNKTYIGFVGADGEANVVVVPDQEPGALDRRPHRLRHVVHHSPTGLRWGYGGSGPADLALSILADHFGERPDRVQEYLRGKSRLLSLAVRWHQQFKWDFIAVLPYHRDFPWTLTTAQIEQWYGDVTEKNNAAFEPVCVNCGRGELPGNPVLGRHGTMGAPSDAASQATKEAGGPRHQFGCVEPEPKEAGR